MDIMKEPLHCGMDIMKEQLHCDGARLLYWVLDKDTLSLLLSRKLIRNASNGLNKFFRVVYHSACKFVYHFTNICAGIRTPTLLNTRVGSLYHRLRLDGSFPWV